MTDDAFVSFYSDKKIPHGAFAGLRAAVKDNISVLGHPFTAGLPLFTDRIGETTAEALGQLNISSADIVGMTRTDSGGLGVLTPEVSNSVHPGHTVGGSSGGLAAAVAADLADFGLGTDTGGSVRIPAACCGVSGFKPSNGLVSSQGVWPLSPAFETIGFIARDPALFDRILALFQVRQVSLPAPEIKLGYDPDRIRWCDPMITAAVQNALEKLRGAGIKLYEIALPDRAETVKAHATVTLASALKIYESAWRTTPHLFTQTAQRALRAADRLTLGDLEAALAALAGIRQQAAAVYREVNAIIGPTLPVLPPPQHQYQVNIQGRTYPAFEALTGETCLANITGGPALSFPCREPESEFVSLHIQAPKGTDWPLLGIVREIATIVSPPSGTPSKPEGGRRA